MKWFAIKGPDEEIVAVANSEDDAWLVAEEVAPEGPCESYYDLQEVGYRCVEVELAEPETTEALKRARLAWAALVSIGARVDCGVANAANAAVRDSAMQVLGEVLGLVEANAASDGGDKEAGE